MVMKRIYIAGPIAGQPDGNREAFRHRAALLESMGFIAVNPHEVDHSHEGECIGDATDRPEDEHRYGCYLRADVEVLMKCDGYTLLPEWATSRGARVERHVASIIGLPLLIFGIADDLLRVVPAYRQLPTAEGLPSVKTGFPDDPSQVASGGVPLPATLRHIPLSINVPPVQTGRMRSSFGDLPPSKFDLPGMWDDSDLRGGETDT